MAPTLIIILLGDKRVGKSASGNTILGRQAFLSRPSINPVTIKIREETENVFGRQIGVIDTPGISSSSTQDIESICQQVIASRLPFLILLVVKIDQTLIMQNALRKAIRLIGDEGFNRCYLLVTGGDTIINMSVEDLIRGDQTLEQLFNRFAGRYHVFNNLNGDREQVRELLLKSGHLRRRKN